jgi:ankyrin repeat protein
MYACVSALIQAGADTNADHVKAEWALGCPLSYALGQQNYEVVDLLLKSGADSNPPGFPPLSIAAQMGRTDILERLLDSYADVNQQNLHGESAMMEAIYFNHAGCVELLIERGARLDLRGNNGCGVLWVATHAGCEVLRLLSQAGIRDNLEWPTLAQYWGAFEEYRQSELFFRHDSIEEERVAFQELLDSVIPESEDEHSDGHDPDDEISEAEDEEGVGSREEENEDEFVDAMEELDLS